MADKKIIQSKFWLVILVRLGSLKPLVQIFVSFNLASIDKTNLSPRGIG
jgi:hypothetical protein